jgi:hypothetical protein
VRDVQRQLELRNVTPSLCRTTTRLAAPRVPGKPALFLRHSIPECGFTLTVAGFVTDIS